jgi:hypothetical protein
MKKIHTAAAALVAAFALAGGAFAQTAPDASAGTPDEGAMSNDTNGSTTMPAEVVPGSVGASGTSSAMPAESTARPSYVMDQRIPTRNEVKVEAASMARAGMIPHGELSTAFQDRGAQLGSTPY